MYTLILRCFSLNVTIASSSYHTLLYIISILINLINIMRHKYYHFLVLYDICVINFNKYYSLMYILFNYYCSTYYFLFSFIKFSLKVHIIYYLSINALQTVGCIGICSSGLSFERNLSSYNLDFIFFYRTYIFLLI